MTRAVVVGAVGTKSIFVKGGTRIDRGRSTDRQPVIVEDPATPIPGQGEVDPLLDDGADRRIHRRGIPDPPVARAIRIDLKVVGGPIAVGEESAVLGL